MKFSWSQLAIRLTSRKFILALVGALVAFGNSFWGWDLTTTEVWSILAPLLAYIGVEGVNDWQKARNGK